MGHGFHGELLVITRGYAQFTQMSSQRHVGSVGSPGITGRLCEAAKMSGKDWRKNVFLAAGKNVEVAEIWNSLSYSFIFHLSVYFAVNVWNP